VSAQSFTLLSDATIVAPKTFTLATDATIVAPKTFDLASDAYIVSGETVILLSDAVIRSNIVQLNLTSDAVIVRFTPPTPPAIAAKFLCKNRINDCACDDDPVSNYSAEGPDLQLFCAVVTYEAPPRLGVCDGGSGFSATEECCSTVSYQDAYLCALRKAQEKIWSKWLTGTCPPPGCPPNCDLGCPPLCAPTCPPFCPPDCPPHCPINLYLNTYQVCSVNCGDGSSFSWAVPYGTVAALSQAEADQQAQVLACQLANRNKICFTTVDLPIGHAGVPYKDDAGNPVQIKAKGGTPFISPTDVGNINFPTECTVTTLPFGTRIPYHYQVVYGALPTGLSFDCFGVLVGTPTTNGNYDFTVKITDAIGATQTKDYEIVIGCSPDPIKYQDSGYKYFQIPSDGVPTTGWQDLAFDDSTWNTGQAAFGSGGACPLQSTVKSIWTVNSDLLVRRKVKMQAGMTNIKFKAAVDNKIVEVWFNGTQISGSIPHDFCPHYDDISVNVPGGLVIAGTNIIAVRVRDTGLESFFDMALKADCP